MKTLIFEQPSLASLPQRFGWACVTAIFWMMWIYLWLPLVTLAFWLLGIFAYGDFIGSGAAQQLAEVGRLALVYSCVVLAMGGGLLLWARVEFVRFHDVNRRTRPIPVGLDEVADYAQLPMEEVSKWSNARRMVAHHDQHGRMISAEVQARAST